MTYPVEPSSSFRMDEQFDDDGALRLVLYGELDLAVAAALRERLEVLKSHGEHVRVDLARLGFMDSSGLRELIVAIGDARRDGWQFEIDRPVSTPVRRVIDLAGVDSYFWP
ncbi:MAG TPA: STAS domain-containing protein [Solirubrobacteraceae bacterium]|nr:STAS domain-containing protein [Solirubrobacteraceae bacterium]